MELMGSESKEKMNNFIDAENEVLKNENDYDSDEEGERTCKAKNFNLC